MIGVVDQIMFPIDVHILIPEPANMLRRMAKRTLKV